MNAPAQKKRPTILCVDDDLLVLRSLREQLQSALGPTCDIELVASANDGLKLLNELAVDGVEVAVLISDQIMPEVKGADFLAAAHQKYPSMFKILLTGHADVQAVSQAVNQGGLYRVLGKPWQEDDLVFTVREALRRAELERALDLQSAALQDSHRQLKRTVQLLQATLNATRDGLLAVDSQGAVTDANPQVRQLWAIPEDLTMPGPASPIVEHIRSQLNDPSQFDLDAEGDESPLTLELTNGRLVEYVCQPRAIGGRRVGTVCSFRDVTHYLRNGRPERGGVVG